jgi:hypothetical protein
VFKKLVGYFYSLTAKLMQLHDSPHSLAGGIAIGMFMGFTPLFGLKTLLCIGAAYLLRCNPIAAVIAVSLHDVVTPFWPVLLGVEYKIGWQVLRFFHEEPKHLLVDHFHVSEVMHWTTFFGVGLPLLVGSMFLSAPAAVASYAVMLQFFKRREKRRGRSRAGEGE